jgi:hypothetical protein
MAEIMLVLTLSRTAIIRAGSVNSNVLERSSYCSSAITQLSVRMQSLTLYQNTGILRRFLAEEIILMDINVSIA